MTAENLINFIDRLTENSAIFSKEPREKDLGLEDEEIALIHSFSSRDWLALRNLNLKERSDFWVECLIVLLDEAYTEDARQMIIHIALTGTEENFYKAMEYIQDFRRNVDTYTWLKLKNRSAEILRSRSNR